MHAKESPVAASSWPDSARMGHPLVYLVRPGRTLIHATRRIPGQLDPPLDHVGLRQAEELAGVLSRFAPSRVVSSPLRRALETAEAIAERAGVRAFVDKRLIDRSYGSCTGSRLPEVTARWGTVDAVPDAEPGELVSLRARAALDDQSTALAHGPVILVGHYAVNRYLLASLDPSLGPVHGIQQSPGCWNVLMRDGPRWLVLHVNAPTEEPR